MKSSLIFLLAFLFNLALSADECLIRFTKRWGAEYYTIFKLNTKCTHYFASGAYCQTREVIVRGAVVKEKLDGVKKYLQSQGECETFRHVE
jgi:hypothetical protein